MLLHWFMCYSLSPPYIPSHTPLDLSYSFYVSLHSGTCVILHALAIIHKILYYKNKKCLVVLLMYALYFCTQSAHGALQLLAEIHKFLVTSNGQVYMFVSGTINYSYLVARKYYILATREYVPYNIKYLGGQ